MVTSSRRAARLVVSVEDEMVFGNSARIKEGIRRLIAPGDREVILDLTRVPFIDSSGVGVLISILKTLEGGNLTVVVKDKMVRRVLEITRMDRIVPIVERVEDALPASDA